MDDKSKGFGEKRKFLWGFRFWIWFFLISIILGVFVAFLSVSGSSNVQDFETAQILRRILAATALVAVVLFFFVLLMVPKVIRRFVRWLVSWRMIRCYLITLGCLVALIALFYAEEDLRGKWAWEKYKSEWEARGEKFDFASLAPPPVPDDKNFAMTPLLKPIFDYVHITNAVESAERSDEPSGWGYTIKWRDSNAYARVRSIDAYEISQRHPTNTLNFGNLDRGTFANLEDLRAFYLDSENYPQPTKSENAAEVILTALSKFDPEFNELQVAAATRPDCRFPLEYNLELPNDILVPHFSIVKNIVLCADVRAVADLELRRNQDAFTNLNIGFRIADSVQNEPLLLSQVVRMATLEKNLQTIREGLARHAWSDAQLEELESRLSSIDLLADGRHAIRGERDSRLATLEFSRRQKWKFGYRFVNHFGGIDLGEFLFRILPDDWEDIAYRLVPYGWFYQNQLNLVRIFQNYALPAIDGDSHRVLLATIKPGLKFTYEHRLGPYHLLASRLAPEMYRTSMTIAKNQTYVDAARVACALERYRLANGYLPEKLDSLVPRYLAKIPNDVIDGQPLRYRLDSDGNYVIYSVGWNQTDDGGVRGRRSFGPNGPFVPDLEQGDWVWTLAAH